MTTAPEPVIREIWLAQTHTTAKKIWLFLIIVHNHNLLIKGKGVAFPLLMLFTLKSSIFIFIWTINVLSISAQQTVLLHMKSGLPCNGQLKGTLYWGKPNNKAIKRLSNGDAVRTMEGLTLKVVYRVRDTVSILLGSGITEKNELFAVADQNKDGNLENDSVYILAHWADKYDFACNLPLICIKGLPLLSVSSNDSVCLRIAPIKKVSWKRFMSPSDVVAYKGEVKASLIDEYYLSGSYMHLDTSYEIRATFSPESYMLRNKPVNGPYVNKMSITVVQTGQQVKFATFQKGIGTLIKAQSDTTFFHKIDNHYLRFDTIDMANNKLVITIRDTPTHTKAATPNLSDAMAQHVGSTMQQDLLLPGRPAIVHFSGSWCRPCHLALPAFKKLYQQYKGQYQFATLLAEKNLAIAQATYKKERIPWPGFYEQLNCKEKDCLQQRLGLSMFPTYAIIGKNGDLVQQVNSVEELEEALQKMAKEAKWKAGLPKM
jgi:thiol-disulfide isomerase/thioredoxin